MEIGSDPKSKRARVDNVAAWINNVVAEMLGGSDPFLGAKEQVDIGEVHNVADPFGTPPSELWPTCTQLYSDNRGQIKELHIIPKIGRPAEAPEDGNNGSERAFLVPCDPSKKRKKTPLDNKGSMVIKKFRPEYRVIVQNKTDWVAECSSESDEESDDDEPVARGRTFSRIADLYDRREVSHANEGKIDIDNCMPEEMSMVDRKDAERTSDTMDLEVSEAESPGEHESDWITASEDKSIEDKSGKDTLSEDASIDGESIENKSDVDEPDEDEASEDESSEEEASDVESDDQESSTDHSNSVAGCAVEAVSPNHEESETDLETGLNLDAKDQEQLERYLAEDSLASVSDEYDSEELGLLQYATESSGDDNSDDEDELCSDDSAEDKSIGDEGTGTERPEVPMGYRPAVSRIGDDG